MIKRASSPKKSRIDLLLVERGLCTSRTEAQRLIMAGEVRANQQLVTKPGTQVSPHSELTIAQGLPFVSRGGLKLEAALDAFDMPVEGKTVADVGASTGGFTDCLLQRGAQRVYAIDVGYGQLAWLLRNDERVVVMERTNARHLHALPERIHLATVDVSFISLTLVLPRIHDWLVPNGAVIALIKPQFEAGRAQVGKGGVVRDPDVHRQVLQRILIWAAENDLPPGGLIRSPLKGPAGNVEFLALLAKSSSTGIELAPAIDRILDTL
jgi:23S rRNA (cytidine1920-2'-O)/16S rRNA (cytidine1409-2'-O)-methyltransferase